MNAFAVLESDNGLLEVCEVTIAEARVVRVGVDPEQAFATPVPIVFETREKAIEHMRLAQDVKVREARRKLDRATQELIRIEAMAVKS